MTAALDHQLPMIITEVDVVSAERISPCFVRVELSSDTLADFGVDGNLYDQRIKIVFPNEHGDLPTFTPGPTWYSDWVAQPDAERGHMRTYTIREVRGSGIDTRLVVDFVLHPDDGSPGPGATWAAHARPGDKVVISAPRRGMKYGGIEFEPGRARDLLLVADETAVPALCGILRDLDPLARGTAFAEVPTAADVLAVAHPPGVHIVWLPREGAPHGVRQIQAVRRHLGLPPTAGLVDERMADQHVWETPTYSSTGEPLTDETTSPGLATGPADLYAWIAGESTVVTTLRRALVRELGLSRPQVAFMGYWRKGVAMKS